MQIRIAIALVTICSCFGRSLSAQEPGNTNNIQDCPMHAQHDANHPHAGMLEHGDQVMGFSHETTSHHFRLMAEGGAVEVAANDAKDEADHPLASGPHYKSICSGRFCGADVRARRASAWRDHHEAVTGEDPLPIGRHASGSALVDEVRGPDCGRRDPGLFALSDPRASDRRQRNGSFALDREVPETNKEWQSWAGRARDCRRDAGATVVRMTKQRRTRTTPL
jgi:hypothetical protein